MRMENVPVKNMSLETNVINVKTDTKTFQLAMNVMSTFLDIQIANPVLAMKEEVKVWLVTKKLEIVSAMKRTRQGHFYLLSPTAFKIKLASTRPLD